MEDTVVVHPGIGIGHLTPMVEFSKLLVSNGLSVAIPIIESPVADSATIAAVIDPISAAYPSITFHRLPPLPASANTPVHPSAAFFYLLRHMNVELFNLVKSLSKERNIRAIILDFFCTDALDVAAELDLPAYFFFASAAATLFAFVSLSTQKMTFAGLKDLGDGLVNIPGLYPIPASHLPSRMLESEEMCRTYLHHFGRLPDAEGIVINTFESIDAKAIKAISEGLCVRDRTMPPIYCVGPVVSRDAGDHGDKHECIRWLDEQPTGSVVLLCFGSCGRFTKEQLREIAEGLERSEQRFLWAVRSPPINDPKKRLEKMPELDLDELLPEGFLERTKDRGLVLKSWAPQTAILCHRATGGFVTHCGWNSTLEAVSAGVPMIAWPLYAEQRMNRVLLVDEMKLAVEMKGYDGELVSADEVAEKVRWIIESEGGKELKWRAEAMKEAAEAALKEGGSSHAAFIRFVKACRGEES